MSFPVVLTIQAASERLHTTPEVIQAELEAKRLDGFKIGGEWRTTEEALLRLINGAPSPLEAAPMVIAEKVVGKPVVDVEAILSGAEWGATEPFSFQWPNGPEWFEEGVAAQVTIGRKAHRICIGFCNRKAAGDENRRRAVVFLGNPRSLIALVEFAGEDSHLFTTTGRMVSIIKLAGYHQHLRPGNPIPPEYGGMPIVTYNEVVTGPYSAGSLAVLAQRDDYNLMARHALFRAFSKGIIQSVN